MSRRAQRLIDAILDLSDLAVSGYGQPVSTAAAFNPRKRCHPMAIFFPTGEIHESWQEYLKPEWQAKSVGRTELVVIVGPERKKALSVIRFPDGGPAVTRYQYELQVRVVEAKTGKLLARNHFISTPPPMSHRNMMAWELTSIGQPVSFSSVIDWIMIESMAGFPRRTK